MSKKLFYSFLFLTVGLSFYLKVQAQIPVEKGNQFISITGAIGGQFYPIEFGDGIPNIGLQYRNALKENWTLKVSYGTGTALTPDYQIIDNIYQIEYEYNTFGLGGSYHFFFEESRKFDAYAGAYLFYYRGNGNFKTKGGLEEFPPPTYPFESEFIIAPEVGIRYRINNSFYVFGEFAYNSYYSMFGISLKI